MKRENHSISTLVESLMQYSIDKAIFIKCEEHKVFSLGFSVRYNDLHTILNITKSTLNVCKCVIDFSSGACAIVVLYDESYLPF